MPATLGNFILGRTLGTGANSKVKIAENKNTGDKVAIKILKKSETSNDAKFLELVLTEVKTMSTLSHGNIVNFLEYNENGVVKKADGREVQVIYIVLELATGGELFDYVSTTGRFNEPIARFYMKQMIDALNYVHTQGVTHRDMKPENLLFDGFFNLKIADFGFAAPIEGRDGTGFNKTKLGTESYMAPEIHLRKPYQGASVDLFASAIILFIMVTQHPPFTRALPDDPFYRLICANRADLFWKAHSKNKPGNLEFFSTDFRNLITAMLQFDPTHRLSMADVIAHPWFNGETATLEQTQQEFCQRKAKIDEEAMQKQVQKEQQKQMATSGGYAAQRRAYRGAHRGEGDEDENEEEKFQVDSQRTVEPYERLVAKNTEFFSTNHPDEILSQLVDFLEKAGSKYDISKDKYKIKATLSPKDSSGSEDEIVHVKFNILEASKDGKMCMEMQRVRGDAIVFFEQFKMIKDFCGTIANATYA
jgi:hypothetical protein